MSFMVSTNSVQCATLGQQSVFIHEVSRHIQLWKPDMKSLHPMIFILLI